MACSRVKFTVIFLCKICSKEKYMKRFFFTKHCWKADKQSFVFLKCSRWRLNWKEKNKRVRNIMKRRESGLVMKNVGNTEWTWRGNGSFRVRQAIVCLFKSKEVERNGSPSECKKQILRMRFKIDKSFVQPPLSPPLLPPSQPKEHNCITEFRRALIVTWGIRSQGMKYSKEKYIDEVERTKMNLRVVVEIRKEGVK